MNPVAQALPGLRPQLMSYAMKLTRNADRAEDLVQDTYARALQYADKYSEQGKLTAWLYQMMFNLFLSQKRCQIAQTQLSENYISGAITIERSTPESRLLAREVLDAAADLPPRLALMIEAKILGLTEDELAARSGIGVGTIKSSTNRARNKLAAQFDHPRGATK